MHHLHFETIDSTNTYLKDNYQSHEDMTFVSADHQTKGRGRSGRIWHDDEKKDLMFSLLLKDELLLDKFGSVSIVSAYTILEVLKEYSDKDITIKWPNDVYVDGKKICGILLEAVSDDRLKCLVVGIGVNLNSVEFNNEYLRTPTSLKLETGKDIDIEEFQSKVFDKLNDNLKKLKDGHDFYEEISKHDYLKNQEAYCLIKGNKEKIKIIGIDSDYSLKIIRNDEVTSISSGEISFHI